MMISEKVAYAVLQFYSKLKKIVGDYSIVGTDRHDFRNNTICKYNPIDIIKFLAIGNEKPSNYNTAAKKCFRSCKVNFQGICNVSNSDQYMDTIYYTVPKK